MKISLLESLAYMDEQKLGADLAFLHQKPSPKPFKDLVEPGCWWKDPVFPVRCPFVGG